MFKYREIYRSEAGEVSSNKSYTIFMAVVIGVIAFGIIDEDVRNMAWRLGDAVVSLSGL